MKIKTQFIVCILVFSLILIVIATSVANTEQQVSQFNAQKEISNNIERGASSLNSVSIDYFLYQEDLQLSRWQSVLSFLSSDLEQLNPSNLQQQTLANNIAGDLHSLNGLFDDVVSYLQSASRNVSVRIDPAFQLRWSSMAAQSQALAFDASQLSLLLDKQAHQTNDTNILLILSLVATFGALLATIYLIVFRGTLKSVTELQKGINTIGSGNLDYIIDSKRQDEISELSHSFNKMTANLKEVTASKNDLAQAQASLRESEQRWATTLASVGDAVIATNLSGKIMFMNGVAEEITGWTLTEASLKPIKEIFNIVNEQTRLEVEDPVSKVLEKGLIVGLANHTVLIRKDRSEVPIDDSGAPIKDKDGKITGVVLVFRDIAKRRQAEQEHERLSAIVESTDDAVIGKTLDGVIISWNRAAEKLYGYTANEMIGKSTSVLIPPDRKSEFQDILEKLYRGEKIEHHDTFRLHKNGTCISVDVTVAPIKNSYGKIIGASTIARDITERKKAEETLKESEQLYHSVFDNSQDGFQLIELIYDKNGKPIDHKFLKVNHAYEKIIGVRAEDILGKTAKYISPNQEFHWLEVPDRVAETGVSEHVELYNQDINKTLDCYYFLTSKNVVGTLFRDITERKNLEKKLQDQERLAAIGATAGMVGHDIRNPLQAITGDLYLAKTELATVPDSEEKKNTIDSLQEIEKNIDYINKIVADLQDFARPLNPHKEEADLKQIIEGLIEKNGLPKNVKVTVKVGADARKIVADSTFINRIMYNLVNNAVQAMPKGGKLTITTYNEANDTIISVKDTGIGIPENVKGKLFTPMFTTKSKGQGFGLAVIKRMAESLGGTVTFESQEGKGTTFIIRLPNPKS